MNTNNANNTNNTFNPSALCSRKLWRIIAGQEQPAEIDAQGLQRAIAELAARRNYLTELQRLGKLGSTH